MKKHKTAFQNDSPYDRASLFSKICFGFTLPLFFTATKQGGLHLKNTERCPAVDQSGKLLASLESNWNAAIKNAEKTNHRPSFFWTLMKTFQTELLWHFSIALFNGLILQLARPLLLSPIIIYFGGGNAPEAKATTYLEATLSAGALCAISFAYSAIFHPNLFLLNHTALKIRASVNALLYSKTLRLSQASLADTQLGGLINLMANDFTRFDDICLFAYILPVAPLQSALSLYILWYYLGVSAFICFAVFLLYIPFQAIMSKLSGAVRKRSAAFTDQRLKMMNEIISGIRVIKMYCWERPFAEKIATVRRSEITQIRRSFVLKALNVACFNAVSRLVVFSCLVTYLLVTGSTFTPEQVFVASALFAILRLNLMFFFPKAIALLSEITVACQRVQAFLELDEVVPEKSWIHPTAEMWAANPSLYDSILRFRSSSIKITPEVRVSKLFAKWKPEESTPTLADITFNLKGGELLAVIGPVGSGKTSLLLALLKEFPLLSGSIKTKGTLSYAAQDAWTFQGYLRENLLFGRPFDRTRFEKVIEVCALKRDLKLMPFGYCTMVGERGVQLSGGQKARLNLARAVYRDADILLLDDPLSAVDAPVQKHIFEKCILDYLKDKIRILVTHQIQFIERADKILVLDRTGHVLCYGTYSEILQQRGSEFIALLEHFHREETEHHHHGRPKRSLTESQRGSFQSNLSEKILMQQTSIEEAEDEEEVAAANEHSSGDQVTDEKLESGAIKGRTYWIYLSTWAGPLAFLFYLFVTIVAQINFSGIDLFLGYWSDVKPNSTSLSSSSFQIDQTTGITIYAALIGLLFFTAAIRALTHFYYCSTVSVRFHKDIFSQLLRAPVAFYDAVQSGRILNRFSSDMGIIDETIPSDSFDALVILSTVIGALGTIILVSPWLAIPSVILLLLVLILRQVYAKVAVDVKRFEGMTRSPIYQHLSTTFHGLASIRAYKAQKHLQQMFLDAQDAQTAIMFMNRSTSRAIGLYIDLLVSLYICVIVAVVMLTDDMTGGQAGLIISSSLILLKALPIGIITSAEIESNMTSVERISEYRSLPQEAPAKTKRESQPPSGWPTGGGIEFQNLSLSYKDNEVLKGLNLIIQPGEKVGVVGRTGAGKTSLISALFRLTEPNGNIFIDGINCRTIGLDDLRRGISIIPQDPVLFTGTIRYNLDPFSQYEDAILWRALEKVQLKAVVENYPQRLDEPLSDAGMNMSVGQRQLICLARAIIRRNRILVADEATSSIDHQTDLLIQSTIRREFASCTVLTVAHRLNTVIDCDRILVLDGGQILEFDEPYTLIRRKSSFYEMAVETGAMFEHLKKVAKRGYLRKHEEEEGEDED